MKTHASDLAKAAASLCLGIAGVAAHATELQGFRGVSWGEDAERLGAAKQVYAQGEMRCYRRERENMMFGDSPLKDVRYCFQQDRLFLVMIEANAKRDDLVSQFQRTYGPPEARSATMVAWGRKAAGTHVEMMSAPGSQHTLLRIYSKEYAPLN